MRQLFITLLIGLAGLCSTGLVAAQDAMQKVQNTMQGAGNAFTSLQNAASSIFGFANKITASGQDQAGSQIAGQEKGKQDAGKETGFSGLTKFLGLSSDNKVTLPEPSAKGTPTEIIKKYQGNKYKFVQNFNGKAIQVTGPVYKIVDSSDDGYIQVIFNGRPDKKPENHGFQDEIVCAVATSEKAATDIEVGKITTATGIYKRADMQFVLHPCLIQ